jgi:hypothetical protein
VLEVPSLSVDRSPQNVTRLAWTPPPGSGLTYALVSAPIAELGGADGIPTASCVGSGLGLGAEDPRPDPVAGQGFYYVVRAESACGQGPYGQTSAGTPRQPGSDCP